jgi:raffinose/stachyose/melibiose transport system permease protein
MVLTALKAHSEVVAGPLTLPAEPRLENFITAWEKAGFSRFFWNSVSIVAPVVAGNLVLATLSGYALWRYSIRGARILLLILLAGLIVPAEAYVVPLYYQLRSMGLLNERIGVVLPFLGSSFVFGTLWMRAYLRGQSRDLTDAAELDGASTLQVIWHVVVPLARPALVTLAVLDFAWYWNAFLIPLVVLSDVSTHPMSLGLGIFVGQHTGSVELLAAAATLVSLPVVAVFLVLQRDFVRGVFSGGEK